MNQKFLKRCFKKLNYFPTSTCLLQHCSFVTCFFLLTLSVDSSSSWSFCFSTVSFSHCLKEVVALRSFMTTTFFTFLQSSHLEFQQSLMSSVEHNSLVHKEESYKIPMTSNFRKRFSCIKHLHRSFGKPARRRTFWGCKSQKVEKETGLSCVWQ